MSGQSSAVKWIKITAGQATVVLLLLLLVETIAFFALPKEDRTWGFFIDAKVVPKSSFSQLAGYGYDQIDPLLGWSMSNKTLQKMGYEVEHNCVVLKSKINSTARPIKIFITGGSTTDLALNRQNWPKYLHQILEEQQVPADIYVAGVGGYNTGQEVLKMIRDGVDIAPDIYISYSGANELFHDYASYYEYDFFSSNIQKSKAGLFLPNTLFTAKRWLGLNTVNLIEETPDTVDVNFWGKNMGIMHGVATEKEAQFVGILQPVLGTGTHRQEEEMKTNAGNLAGYREYYGALENNCKQHPAYLYDMTTTFDSINGKVFVDDCHLSDAYQPILAQKILAVLRSRKLL